MNQLQHLGGVVRRQFRVVLEALLDEQHNLLGVRFLFVGVRLSLATEKELVELNVALEELDESFSRHRYRMMVLEDCTREFRSLEPDSYGIDDGDGLVRLGRLSGRC